MQYIHVYENMSMSHVKYPYPSNFFLKKKEDMVLRFPSRWSFCQGTHRECAPQTWTSAFLGPLAITAT